MERRDVLQDIKKALTYDINGITYMSYVSIHPPAKGQTHQHRPGLLERGRVRGGSDRGFGRAVWGFPATGFPIRPGSTAESEPARNPGSQDSLDGEAATGPRGAGETPGREHRAVLERIGDGSAGGIPQKREAWLKGPDVEKSGWNINSTGYPSPRSLKSTVCWFRKRFGAGRRLKTL